MACCPLALLLASALALAAEPAVAPAAAVPDPATVTATTPSAAAGEPATPPITEADLEPVFPPGPLSRARDDLVAGRNDAAAQALAGARAPEARFLRAVALVEARRGPEAVEALSGLERKLPDLADRIAYWRGRGHELAGDSRAAAAAYAAVPTTSLRWGEAQLGRARNLAGTGDRAGALEALAPVLSLPPPDEAGRGDVAADALLLAGRLRAGGQDDEPAWARRALVECWAGHPLSPTAATCLAELKRLTPPLDGAPSPEDALRHAEGLLDANRNGPALAELAQLVPKLPPPGPGQPLACRAGFALGKAHRKERQHTRAIEVLRPVVDGCQDPVLRPRAAYFLASASAVVEPEAAVTWYRTLARDYPGHPLADDALFYAADLLARAGKDDEARAALSELADRYPQGDFRAEALFRAAWIEKAAGRLDPALATLARLERDYESSDPYEYARAAYWEARLRAERNGEGDAERAREAWRLLAERHPADYYGLLARARLEEAKPGSAPPWPRGPGAADRRAPRYHPGRLPQDPHFRAGLLLLRMGLDRAAADELNAVDRKAVASGDPLLLVAELLDRAGDHRSSSRLVRTMARTVLKARPEGAALRVWRVAYPIAYRSEVERWAPPAGVPSELLLALMREESGLDPGAISAAGAVGLTQLMLPTAQEVARKLKMGKVRAGDLTQPAVAIRIGATYFGGLLRKYDGSEALALAAYNAGHVPVRNWLRARGSLPLDAFVEEIPVQETRGYVKRVLRSYAAYRFLYGTGAARPVLLGQALPAPR